MVSPRDLFKEVKTGIHLEKAIPTMSKKLVITVAPTGSFNTRAQNPHQPYTAEEVAMQVIDSCKEGASVFHVHVRDRDGTPAKEPEVIMECEDMILDRCPDIIFSNNVASDYSKAGVGRMKPMVDGLVEFSRGSRKYIHTAVIKPSSRVGLTEKPGYVHDIVTGPVLKEMIEYLNAKGVKTEFQISNYSEMDTVQEWVIQRDILKKPYLINLLLGYHAMHPVAMASPDPWGHINLMTMMQMVPEGSAVGATIGGRNWLPLTIEAIMLGVDCVRVGMEDAVFMYPHKEEKIRDCASVVKKIAAIARELGRDIATPSEAKQILGLD